MIKEWVAGIKCNLKIMQIMRLIFIGQSKKYCNWSDPNIGNNKLF